MSESPDRPKHLELRASDADRERVAKILHDAMGAGRLTLAELDERLTATYAAKTLGELVPLTSDLPEAGTTAALAQPIPVMPDNRIGGVPGPSVSVGVMSGFERSGGWVVPAQHTALALMGGGKLDLTEARFAEQDTTIWAFALMGGIEIIVPDDITVRVQGFGFMGGFNHRTAADGPPGGPILRINGFALMGGVDVKRRARPRKQID